MMTQKTALILAAVLTAFVLVIGGGIAARVSQPDAPVEAAPVVSAPVAPAPAASAATSTIDVNTQVEQLLQQREAQYRQLIEEANRRLQQANQQLAAARAAAPARSEVSAAPAAQAAQPAQPTVSLSAESARNIAIDAAGGATMIRQPELVLFEGKVAYEVGFTRGAVYVDANTGAVLYDGTHGNGVQSSGGTQPQPQPSNGEHESDQETESHD